MRINALEHSLDIMQYFALRPDFLNENALIMRGANQWEIIVHTQFHRLPQRLRGRVQIDGPEQLLFNPVGHHMKIGIHQPLFLQQQQLPFGLPQAGNRQFNDEECSARLADQR